jgi:hypothetical protein
MAYTETMNTADNRALLLAAARAQTKYWDAVRKLELALAVEIDDLDFSTVSTVEDVMEFCESMAEANPEYMGHTRRADVQRQS